MKSKLTFFFVMLSLSLHAQQRLIAEARYYDTTNIGNPGVLVLRDSSALSYSNGRGSSLDPNRLDYFDLNRFQGSGALINFFDHVAPANNVDSGAAYPHVAFDTLRYYDANPYYGIRLDQTEACTYYGDGSFYEVSHINQSQTDIPYLLYKQVLQYTAGQLSRIYGQYIANGSYYIGSARYLVRDAGGRILVDSTVFYKNGSPWHPDARTLYTYNPTGQYLTRLRQQYSGIADSFTNEIRNINTYYPDGRLQTSLVEIPAGSSGELRPYLIDSFGYTPGVRGYTTFTESLMDLQGLPAPTGYFYTAHVNANFQKDTITILQMGGTRTDRTVQVPKYNSYGNPESNTYDYYVDSSKIHQWKSYYYYESYQPTAVPPRKKSTADIVIIPNPTTGLLSLRYPDAQPGALLTVRIMNASGQLVQLESFTMLGSSQQILLGPEAAAGTYYLSVYNANNELLCTRALLKQ